MDFSRGSTNVDHQQHDSTKGKSDASPGGFVMIERAFQRDTRLSFEARSLAQLIAGFEGQDGEAFPGIPKLKKLTGWSGRRIMKYRTELRQAGRLKRWRQRQPNGTFFGGAKYRTVGVLHPPDPAKRARRK